MIDELVVRAKGGDVDAFDRLRRSGRRPMLRDRPCASCATITPPRTSSRQASSARGGILGSLRDTGRFEPWLHRIVVNACYREARRRRWTSSVGTLPSEDATPSDDGLVSDRDELERGLRSLSPEHRAVLVMHYYLDLGIEDIAERTACRSGPPIQAPLRELGPARSARGGGAAHDVASGGHRMTGRRRSRSTHPVRSISRTNLCCRTTSARGVHDAIDAPARRSAAHRRSGDADRGSRSRRDPRRRGCGDRRSRHGSAERHRRSGPEPSPVEVTLAVTVTAPSPSRRRHGPPPVVTGPGPVRLSIADITASVVIP